MTLLWIVAVVGWVIALAAFITARGAARRLAQLTDMYWALKYDHGELKARVRALAGEDAAPPPPRPSEAFVPLTDVKKRS